MSQPLMLVLMNEKIGRFSALVILIRKGSDLVYLEKNEKMSLGSFTLNQRCMSAVLLALLRQTLKLLQAFNWFMS
ncbi:MAG: hypothetical protein M3044_17440, partial [Thermoproteota archaeon]|nr:hypothetical protein [Thermoproteota archaeon]